MRWTGWDGEDCEDTSLMGEGKGYDDDEEDMLT